MGMPKARPPPTACLERDFIQSDAVSLFIDAVMVAEGDQVLLEYI